ncbi:MAG TPA: N-acetyltransferase [Firmicutes bacterium]|nr:N-acetyltransferase [Bacillota bacterium]
MKIIKTKEYIKYLDENENVIAEILFPLINQNTNCITRTYVSDSLRGQGIAKKLVIEALEIIKKQGHNVEATCSYAKNFLDKN